MSFKDLSLMKDKKKKNEEGKNELKLIVTDHVGNSAIFETTFFRSQKNKP